MRDDINKILCERPRAGSGRDNYHNRVRPKLKHQLYRDPESMMTKEKMKKVYGYNRKELNENLSPLKRMVESKIGQNWDEVYSQFRKAFPPNTAVNVHIYQHLFFYIEVNTFIGSDGEVWYSNRYQGENLIYECGSIYVHPVTKTICPIKKNPVRHAYEEKCLKNAELEKLVRRVVNDALEYRKINDIWYEVEFRLQRLVMQRVYEYIPFYRRAKDATEADAYQYVTRLGGERVKDAITNKVFYGDCISRRYAFRKRQLNKKEIRNLKLPK